ncbi:alginate export family protein [Chryseobacterium sp. Y16C]|uniref:alginate export family protein n=1 Tax=Chryseobacterium sp. Y16C TaxID=2920939 RepID=UPI001F0A8DEB|nr:alginate export family protein [Chryseobacterium sp. Y16C]UMQ42260.1 alginate export family protein [Chryseobacterium sp. Y16C]
MLKSAPSILFLKAIFITVLLCSETFSSQSFKLLRYDENYEYLKDSTKSYDKIKYLPLNEKKDIYLSLGGEARFEYVDFNNEDWGRLNIGHNDFFLQRYDLHADWHFGENFRIFSQIRSALQNGRKNGSRGIDEDQLNIQNLFLDAGLVNKEDQKLILRLGRQELDYGSGRLISVREGPNARLSFTGAKIMYSSKNISVDAFAMMADSVRTGVFDNTVSKQLNLWGLYSKIIIPEAGNLDLYYLGIRRDESVFEAGTAREKRHTVGGRLWKYGGGFIYNLEAAYQFGRFGNEKISAWTGSIDIGYLFENFIFRPSINLRNDYISGDHSKNDGKLNTFNPLYPKGGYFGFSPQVGPVNLIDIHPYMTLDLTSKLKMQMDVVFNWRYSLNDGVYRPSGALSRPGSSSDERYIGTAYLMSFTYNFNKHFSLVSGLQYFHKGPFIEDIIQDAKSGVFWNIRLGFKL